MAENGQRGAVQGALRNGGSSRLFVARLQPCGGHVSPLPANRTRPLAHKLGSICRVQDGRGVSSADAYVRAPGLSLDPGSDPRRSACDKTSYPWPGDAGSEGVAGMRQRIALSSSFGCVSARCRQVQRLGRLWGVCAVRACGAMGCCAMQCNAVPCHVQRDSRGGWVVLVVWHRDESIDA